MKNLSIPQRLIVAVDFKPDLKNNQGRKWVWNQVTTLAKSLKGMGVYLKVNSALRTCGYNLIDEIHSLGLLVFADLKLFDIKETLTIDGILLREAKPELLTVVASSGIDSMSHLKMELPDTEMLGVQILTNLRDEDTMEMFGHGVNYSMIKFSGIAREGKVDGLICSAKEARMLRQNFGDSLTLNTPAIRPTWTIVPGDDQNPDRIMTPTKAIEAGVDRIVIGRPITQAKEPKKAVMLTLEEIASAL